MSDRRALIRHLALAATLGPAGLAGLIREALANGEKPVAAGMRKVSGTVTVNGQLARTGMAVNSGDTIVTGNASEAIYVIGQDAFLQREKSTVSFAAGAATKVMRVISGKLLSVFAKGDRRLETPTATIGIRGTGCYIEAEEDNVYFCLCYGMADVIPLADPTQVEHIETRHHDHPITIHRDQAMPMMAPAAVINHTDAELILLENLTGRWPPFYGRNEETGAP